MQFGATLDKICLTSFRLNAFLGQFQRVHVLRYLPRLPYIIMNNLAIGLTEGSVT